MKTLGHVTCCGQKAATEDFCVSPVPLSNKKPHTDHGERQTDAPKDRHAWPNSEPKERIEAHTYGPDNPTTNPVNHGYLFQAVSKDSLVSTG